MPELFTIIDGTMYKLEEVEPADYLECCWDFCEDEDDAHCMEGGACAGVCVDGETGGIKTNYEFMEKMQGAFEHAKANGGLTPFEAGPDTDNLPHARHRFSCYKVGDEVTFQVPGEALRSATVVETLENGQIRVETLVGSERRLFDPQDNVSVFKAEPEKEHGYGI